MNHSDHPHKRYNPLEGSWVLVSPHRTKRPWKGKVESASIAELPAYDPGCYLCPGNTRAGGEVNPRYDSTFVFDNDFAALIPDAWSAGSPDADHPVLFRAHGERGICRVLCFSPRHDLTLARMTTPAIRTIVDMWVAQYQDIGAIPWINHVQIFENRGDIMGCSNPHPHGQLWANESIPFLPAREQEHQRVYRDAHGSCLLCDYCAEELKREERIVFANSHFMVVVPYWALWPFEVMILPRAHESDITTMTDEGCNALADALRRMTTRYDNLFSCSFPYSMGIHGRPTDGQAHDEWHWHIHFYPPLLRSATVKKFMVGYEMLAEPQRDITAEQSAERLRGCGERHYGEG